MQAELARFAQKLAKNGPTEVGCAVALLWFLEREQNASEVTPAYLAELMHDLALKGRVNMTRFKEQLLKHSDIIRGKANGTVKLRLVSKSRLDEKYAPLCGNAEPVQTDDHVLAANVFDSKPNYLSRLVAQINGCYHFGFHDGCAVLCRRLMERLLILAFEKQGHSAIIRDASGENRPLADLIGLASSGQYFKLARGTDRTMAAIKVLGDTAAHHPVHLTRQKDI